MKELSADKIDIFSHVLPPKYKAALYKKAKQCFYLEAGNAHPALWDLDIRFSIMDKYQGLVQVLSLGLPPTEYVVNPDDAADFSRIANDEMADWVAKYPDRFVAAVACLPMNNIDAALKELDRAIGELNFKGVQIYTPVNGRPMDSPEFMELYQKMAAYDLPIWIHPTRDRDIPDYRDEIFSKYRMFATFGWPYETTLAMARLVFSGVLEKYPNIKFIAHHCGGMVPFFEQRIALRKVLDTDIDVNPEYVEELAMPPRDYFQKFYADTAIAGNVPGLMCGYAFFGSENLLFGTDYPYGGELKLQQTIISVESMNIPDSDKEKIFKKNAERILRFNV